MNKIEQQEMFEYFNENINIEETKNINKKEKKNEIKIRYNYIKYLYSMIIGNI